MEYGEIPPIEKSVSRLVMGTMPYQCATDGQAFELFDHFVGRGGNCFDTAFVYETEDVVGRWVESRQVQSDLVFVGKGAHTPDCNPEAIAGQVEKSLDRLRIERFDLYMLHRDDETIPAAEFVGALAEQQTLGRIHAYGMSNWSVERIREAQLAARNLGVLGIAASSVNYSLARWNEPWWPGSMTATDPKDREWYLHGQMPLLAWSSQASGFFASDVRPETAESEWEIDMVRVWWNEDNERRRSRARQLAAQLGVTPLQIALAYVMTQDLNIFALIGPRRPQETEESLGALDIEFGRREVHWLETGVNVDMEW
jgi:aryl-alcohol dehydrogenase-like predicted oxidoreductase